MTTQTVTDIIRARAHGDDRSGVWWSVALHVLLGGALVVMPASWRQHVDDGPRTVMTISLGGTPGPRNGGETPMGGRAVAPTPVPTPTPRVADAPPPPKAPEMALPDRKRPPRKVAPSAASSTAPRTAATAAPTAAEIGRAHV